MRGLLWRNIFYSFSFIFASYPGKTTDSVYIYSCSIIYKSGTSVQCPFLCCTTIHSKYTHKMHWISITIRYNFTIVDRCASCLFLTARILKTKKVWSMSYPVYTFEIGQLLKQFETLITISLQRGVYRQVQRNKSLNIGSQIDSLFGALEPFENLRFSTAVCMAD